MHDTQFALVSLSVFQLAPQDPGVKQEKLGVRVPKALVSSAEGTSFERRGGRVWRGFVPTGGGAWEVDCAPPQNFFSIFELKSEFWCILDAIFAVE